MEEEDGVESTEEREEGVAAHDHRARAPHGKAAAPQAHDDKTHAKAQQRGEHGQASNVRCHRCEEDCGVIRARDGAAKVVGALCRIVIEEPCRGRVGERNAQQSESARDVGDEHAGWASGGIGRLVIGTHGR